MALFTFIKCIFQLQTFTNTKYENHLQFLLSYLEPKSLTNKRRVNYYFRHYNSNIQLMHDITHLKSITTNQMIITASGGNNLVITITG